MLDCIIKGGTLVDGTGAPRRQADVGIRDGRVAAVGTVTESATRTIDAAGKIVAPGFVDIHTHFDAQAFWDPALTPSSLHGVTTVVGGNCGFSIAPLTPDAGPYLMRMLSRVEGMPLEALEAGVPWNWRTFGEYLGRLDGRLAINAGFLVGHSALRRVVMGEAAVGSTATAAQLQEMVRLLHESLAAGGLGFSSSQAPTHNDGDGKPVPSRHATRDELVALAGALRDHDGTSLEFIPTVGLFGEEHKELMAAMSRAANRPLNWNVLNVIGAAPDMYRSQLTASDYAREHGGEVVALTLPQPLALRLNLISGFVLDALPGWAAVIALPLDERKKAFADPAVRQQLDAGANSDEAGVFRYFGWWSNYNVDETFKPENAGYRGRNIGEIATDTGQGAVRHDARPGAVGGPENIVHADGPGHRRRDLAIARRGVARSARAHRRIRRRRAPRHDRHLRPQHDVARHQRARARAALAGRGDPPPQRPPGALLRHSRPRPHRRGLARRRRHLRRSAGRTGPDAHPPRPAGGRSATVRRSRGHRARAGERDGDRARQDCTGASPGTVLRSGRDTTTVTPGGRRD